MKYHSILKLESVAASDKNVELKQITLISQSYAMHPSCFTYQIIIGTTPFLDLLEDCCTDSWLQAFVSHTGGTLALALPA